MKTKIHYAWIILFAAFFAILAVQGLRLSFGAFIEPWEEAFAADRSTLSLISMVSFVIYGVSQPIIGRLIDRYGVRLILTASTAVTGISMMLIYFAASVWHVLLLFSIVASVGFGGASNVAASVAITNWFKKKKGLAFGLVEAGFAGGQMLLVPASLLLIQWVGWRDTVIILGLFTVAVVAPVAWLLIRTSPRDKGMRPYGEAAGQNEAAAAADNSGAHPAGEKSAILPFRQMMATRKFWFVILPFFVCGVTTTGLMDTHLIPYAHSHGFSTDTTAAAVSVLAAFNIVGTLLSGAVADRFSSRLTLALLYTLRAVSLVILLAAGDPLLLLLFAALFGLVDFATVAPTQFLLTEYFKRYAVGSVIGWLLLSHQIGSALGAYLPGLLYDWTGGYQFSFYASVILLIAAAILNLLLPEPSADDGPRRPGA